MIHKLRRNKMGRRKLTQSEKLNRKLERLQKEIEKIRESLVEQSKLIDDSPEVKKEE
jgi:hypothetical protein